MLPVRVLEPALLVHVTSFRPAGDDEASCHDPMCGSPRAAGPSRVTRRGCVCQSAWNLDFANNPDRRPSIDHLPAEQSSGDDRCGTTRSGPFSTLGVYATISIARRELSGRPQVQVACDSRANWRCWLPRVSVTSMVGVSPTAVGRVTPRRRRERSPWGFGRIQGGFPLARSGVWCVDAAGGSPAA